MESKEGRTWIVEAFMYFLPVLFLWVIAALWVGSSFGVNARLLADIRTSLFADYSPDIFNQSFRSLKLAIYGEVFSDSELSADAMTGLQRALQGLVPTATLRPGDLAWTMTPEFTSTVEPPVNIVLSETPIPTNTSVQKPTKTPTPSQPSTATATKIVPTATLIHEAVVPLLQCVQDNDDGTLTAFFGYKNPNDRDVEIPIGEQNKFTPGSEDRGQPTCFEARCSPETCNIGFQVVFDSESITWVLDGGSVTASATSNRCDPIVPEEIKDTQPPQLSGGDLEPPPKELEACSIIVIVDDLRVVDAAPSSGIAWVKLLYNVEGYTTDPIHSNPLTLCSGGWTEDGGWDGCYNGSIMIKIDPEWIPTDASTPFRINLCAKAHDNAGNDTCYFLGQYSMPACCGTCPED